MRKSRVTDSIKARRAAEAQQRALEAKIQLDWAWKPLAAIMNENSTDLVYWVPPIYNSNIGAAVNATRQGSVRKKLASSRRRTKLMTGDDITEEMTATRQGSVRKKLASSRRRTNLMTGDSITEEINDTPTGSARKKLASSRRRTKLMTDDSITEEITDTQQGPVRKKLASSRRRSKLSTDDSITEEMEEDRSAVKDDDSTTYCLDDKENNSTIIGDLLPAYDEWENEDDNESGIHEESDENPLEYESGSKSNNEMSDIDKEILKHNSLIRK
ncbi:unnamed protein product, partial [Meganyctiphanes norvegica]